MARPTSFEILEDGGRVEDYLNDSLQTVADLENVNDLLAKVKAQQELLRQQLAEAKSASEDAERAANTHDQALAQRAGKFQQEQADIDRRLQVITQSDVSDNAVRIFETKMTKLRRLEVAEGYVEVLKEVHTLTDGARKNITSDPTASIASYTSLRLMLYGLQAAQPAAEGAAPHLVDQVEQQTKALSTDLQANLDARLRKVLTEMMWPKKELTLTNENIKSWADVSGLLLDLQTPNLTASPMDTSTGLLSEPVILLPIRQMVAPLSQRFKYHFYGERPTNRLDKPEYFFSHVLDLIEQHSPFMTRFLQPVLDERMRKSAELEAVYPDAVSAFITALLPMVSIKCLSLLPQISSQPQLLSHFIHELMAFDSTLRDSWVYVPIAGAYVEWKGMTWEMLNTHGYFGTWLEVEKEFALNRYKKIRDSAESSNIEYEGVEAGRSKPTKGAIRVNDLLETITDRYRGLSSFSQKMKFLMEVQLAIFDDYHGFLHGALQAFLASSHTAGRLIQGQKDNDTGGLKGLETLSKVFGSAEYLDRKMSDWSEDLFFLELWEELQDRARRNTRDGSIGRDLTVEDVAAKTSSTIKQNDSVDESEGGALFDETALSYRRLREQSEREIVRLLDTSIRNSIRPLTAVRLWSSLSAASADITSLSTTSALDTLLSTLSTLLDFLAQVTSRNALRRIVHRICQTLQREIYDSIFMRNTFSAAGAAQMKRDVIAIEDAIDSSIKMPSEASRNLRKLEEALTLLNLPVKASSGRMSKIAHPSEEGDDDGWGFDDEGDNNNPDPAEEAESDHRFTVDSAGATDKNSASWGLWEAEKAIFASNESARRLLADMGLELVSEGEARELIRRRVEINS